MPRPRRVLFVTGRLAEPALRRVLAEMAPPFATDVAVLKITVAALMTTPWIARFLEVPAGTDLVLIPGLCEGDAEVLRERFGVRVEKGPKDLREIPRYFGRAAAARDYGAWDIEILAEINNAPRLTRRGRHGRRRLLPVERRRRHRHRLHAGLAFPGLGDVVRELRRAGMRVSVDTFDPDEIRTAVAAGAELVLSVNGSNIDVARDLAGTGARVVVDPRSRRRHRHARAEHRGARSVGRALPDRPDPRADRLRVHGLARALRRSAAPLSRRRRC